MNIRCLIVDDEPPALRLIGSYAQQIPGIEVAAVCNNALDAFGILHAQKIDLIFLDIKMPKLMGTDFLKNLPNAPKVIFITAYREYALDGYDLDIVDYLLKPVSFARFMKAVTKSVRLITVENNFSSLENVEYNENKDAFLYFKIDKEITKVLLNEILYIESCKEYVKIHFDNKKMLLVKQRISAMEKLLSPHRFIRVHRCYIAFVEKITSFNAIYISIHDEKGPIGRLYKNEIDAFLKHL